MESTGNGQGTFLSRHGLNIAVLVLYVISVVGTLIGNTGAYGCTNKEISENYNTLITPPGWAFSIWGIIFIWEGLSCLYQLIPNQKAKFVAPIIDRTFVFWWGCASFLGPIWTVTFCYSVDGASAVLILLWLALFALQFTSLRKFLLVTDGRWTQLRQYMLLIAPFSLHMGWCTAASALNVNLSVVAHNSTPATQVAVAVATCVWIAVFGWTFGLWGNPLFAVLPSKRMRVAVDPAAFAAVVWALGAVSAHDATLSVSTSEGKMVFPVIVTRALQGALDFVVPMLLICCFSAWAFKIIRSWKYPDAEENAIEPGEMQKLAVLVNNV